MGHNHSHSQPSAHNIRTVFFLNLAFTLFEIVGGLLTNSVAIIADAIHDLGDSLSLGLAWYLQNFSQKASNPKYTYGYRRFSLLGALINAVVLSSGALFVLAEAVPRLINPQQSDATGMILFAVVGIVTNGVAVFRLQNDQTMNARIMAWHLLEDVLGWIAVLMAGVILIFFEIPIIDPILAVLFTLYILFNVLKNLRETLSLFLQRAPANVDVDHIEKQLLEIDGVLSSHHTHLWSLDGEHHVLTTHLVIDPNASRRDVLRIKLASHKLVSPLNIEHLTLEIEYEGETCYLHSPDQSAP